MGVACNFAPAALGRRLQAKAAARDVGNLPGNSFLRPLEGSLH